MKRIRLTKVDLYSIGICLLSIVPGFMVYSRLPEEIPVHFGLNGNPNGYASRLFAILGIPLIVTLIQVIYCITSNLLRRDREMNRAERVIRFLPPVVLYISQIFILMYSMGKVTNVITVLGAVETAVFLILGNYLPKVRRTLFYGIRTPHTLASEELWDKTHRFAGVIYVIAGVVCMIITVVGLHPATLLVLLLFTVGIPFIYSEILYRRMKKNSKVLTPDKEDLDKEDLDKEDLDKEDMKNVGY